MNRQENNHSDIIHVTPGDFTYNATAFFQVSSQRVSLPDYLELPLLWACVHKPDVVFTTTISKLLAIKPTEAERALHHSNRDREPEPLRITLWLWTRTVIFVMNRLANYPFDTDLEVMSSQLWTEKVFQDQNGQDWTSETFLRKVHDFLDK